MLALIVISPLRLRCVAAHHGAASVKYLRSNSFCECARSLVSMAAIVQISLNSKISPHWRVLSNKKRKAMKCFKSLAQPSVSAAHDGHHNPHEVNDWPFSTQPICVRQASKQASVCDGAGGSKQHSSAADREGGLVSSC